MKYKVEIAPSAEKDIDIAYVWGCEQWGIVQAKKWMRDLMVSLRGLSSFPLRYALAPESDEVGEANRETRQMVFQRYRVLFEVVESTVRVIHFRGAYKGEVSEEEE